MAVMTGHEPITEFEQWYERYEIDERHGCLEFKNISDKGQMLWRLYTDYKREMDARVANYHLLEKLADGEVISPKPDLPNISSGETAGLVRRTARNLVQNTPNVEIISSFDDDGLLGIFSRHILLTRIIGSDNYSNDMQQNLFASTKTSLTLGFNCVIPVLLKDAGGWYIKYDSIHYRDVFPEPGVKDVRDSSSVFIRRYLTKGDVQSLVRTEAPGWDIAALKLLLKHDPPSREAQSVDHQTAKHRGTPKGYEIITWYNDRGENFLTFSANTKILLRIEKNKHPLKKHPVHFLVLEKDDQQPLGKSQVELLVGRQDFQDLMLNGAMKLWYRNINPSIIGYGTVNSIPNLSPGKYTQISNPNAKIEAFEVNTQTLLQYGAISQQNMGSMVNLLGTADQQMAAQAGNGMSATPQGVEAQTALVDITTNNYQKAIEGFFSHYCSYALTIFFQELKATKAVAPTAEARQKLMKAGLKDSQINKDGTIDIDFEDLAVEYFVRCVPGSLTEMEDEKQLRILNQLFVPLSQAMPAMANAGDPAALKQAGMAMQYIITKQLELSGASDASALAGLWSKGNEGEVDERDKRIAALELRINNPEVAEQNELLTAALLQMQEQMSQQTQINQALFEKLGIQLEGSAPELNSSSESGVARVTDAPTVLPASA